MGEDIVSTAEKIASKFEGELTLDLELMRAAHGEASNEASDTTPRAIDAQAELGEDERMRLIEINRLLREEEEVKGVSERMANFARLLGLWS